MTHTYEKIDYNPLVEVQKSIFKKVVNWRLKGYLGKNIERNDLITDSTNLARLYSLPKIDKENCQLRPVVWCIDLSVSSLFTNLPMHLVLTGIEKRWHHICKFTALPLEESKDGIKLHRSARFCC